MFFPWDLKQLRFNDLGLDPSPGLADKNQQVPIRNIASPVVWNSQRNHQNSLAAFVYHYSYVTDFFWNFTLIIYPNNQLNS